MQDLSSAWQKSYTIVHALASNSRSRMRGYNNDDEVDPGEGTGEETEHISYTLAPQYVGTPMTDTM